VMCEDYEVYFLRRSIVEVTDPREGGDVRGSPLAVIMGLVDSRKAHTTPRLASTLPSDMPFIEGSYQSREEPGVVSRSEPRTPTDFFHFQKLCGTCL